MPKPSYSATSHLFTVRLWFEDLGGGHCEWRGEVRDVATGRQHFFREWDAMVGFFRVACIAFKPDLPVRNLE